MSEKVRKRGCEGAAVDGTIAPSGTWWTTLGPFFFESVSNNISLAHAQGNLTLLSVEFAVENSLNHGGLLAPCLPGLVGKDGLNLKRTP